MPSKTTNDQLLQELRTIGDKVERGFYDHGQRLAKMETKMESVLLDEETGRLPSLERDVRGISNKVYFWSGAGAALSTLIHFIFPHKG